MTPDTAEAAQPLRSQPVAAAFAVRSRFVIANGMEQEVRAAFRSRPHLVDSAAGFVRMEVLSPLDRPAEIWLMTYWASQQNYRDWHDSHNTGIRTRGSPRGCGWWARKPKFGSLR